MEEEYAFINSNSDFNPYPIIADNSEKKCLLCKSNSKPDEIITLSSEITVKLEKPHCGFFLCHKET